MARKPRKGTDDVTDDATTPPGGGSDDAAPADASPASEPNVGDADAPAGADPAGNADDGAPADAVAGGVAPVPGEPPVGQPWPGAATGDPDGADDAESPGAGAEGDPVVDVAAATADPAPLDASTPPTPSTPPVLDLSALSPDERALKMAELELAGIGDPFAEVARRREIRNQLGIDHRAAVAAGERALAEAERALERANDEAHVQRARADALGRTIAALKTRLGIG